MVDRFAKLVEDEPMPFKRTALVLSILTARPASSFMAGKWALSWHATSSDDGHKSEGSNFIVK